MVQLFSCDNCSETFVNTTSLELHTFEHVNIAQLDGNVSVNEELNKSEAIMKICTVH